MLKRIVLHREKAKRLKNKIKKALFYPCAVIGIAIIITCFFITVIIPQFAELFVRTGSPLPLPTQFVIYSSIFLKHNLLFIVLFLILLIYMIILIRKFNQKAALFCDQRILKLPIIGKLLKKSMIARLATTLNTTFSAGIPLLEALQSSRFIANNHLFTQTIQQAGEFIEQGQSLHEAFEKTDFFPEIVIQMIAIGEETGKLDDMFEKIIDFYETEVEYITDVLVQLLEPTITIILGIMTGGLIIAMYLPIFKLGMVIK